MKTTPEIITEVIAELQGEMTKINQFIAQERESAIRILANGGIPDLHELHRSSGLLSVYSSTVEFLENSQTSPTEFLLSLVSRGAEDSWSGRGNDANRSRFDGIRQAAKDINFSWRLTSAGK